jgi:hypothetical protein
MAKIIYVPLEHIEGRYTVHMDRDILDYLETNQREYVKIYPQAAGTSTLPEGCFLNAAYTSKFKSMQMAMIAGMYERGEVQDGDTFFFSDIWFPGIESIAYMNYFHKVDAKITGIIHAGSFTDTDFVRDMERWAKNFEDIIFDISDKIFCASEFIKQDILKKRYVSADKLVVTGLPVDHTGLDQIDTSYKEPIVIFNGRLCDEKQPWLFDELAKQVTERISDTVPNVRFLKTQELNLSKQEYYNLLGQSQVIVSYALQENFGFGVAEAAYLGCTPVLPNRLVYPELYNEKHLFDRFEQSVDMVCEALTNYREETITIPSATTCIEEWFK